MRTHYKLTNIAMLLMACLIWSIAAGEDIPDKTKKKSQPLDKIAGSPTFAVLDINNYVNWVRYDGPGNLSPAGDNQAIFPFGTGNAIYTDGVYWGGKVYTNAAKTSGPVRSQLIRVGGKGYGFGMNAGWINGSGSGATRQLSTDANVRIFRIRRDYLSMSDEEARRDAAASNEISPTAVTDAQIAALRQQYGTDWSEWPASSLAPAGNLGAPYVERNGTPGYQRPPAFDATFTVDSLIEGKYDEPGVAGIDPNSPADQVIWTVANDLDRSKTVAFNYSEPVGLEVQFTIWGYKRTDALGNLFFKRIKMINKGGVDTSHVSGTTSLGSFWVDSMYVCNWSDIDLGSFSDDLAGCDSTLSMAFVYNANAVDNTYKNFSLAPPASGYDFLQGPRVPGAATDSAVFDLKRIKGYKNLGMTSFAYFSAGSPYSDPCNLDVAGYSCNTGQWWKMLRGYAPLGNLATPDIPYDFGTFPLTNYPLSGDPVAGTGFLDGAGTTYSFVPGDRRILSNTGPFSLAPGDTQEIVVGVVAGLGADRLSSVAAMKSNDKSVQSTYDLLFKVTRPPANPDVKVTELDGRVIIEWGSNLARVSQTENTISQPGNYVFEGYNIYQLPARGSRLSEAKRIVTYDLPAEPRVIFDTQFDLVSGQLIQVPIQFGTNSGIKRYFDFSRDHYRDINKLYNGQEYYLVVTAYSRALDLGFVAALESSPNAVTVRPKQPFGVVPMSKFGDTVKVTRTSGISDGSALVTVVSPTLVTGHNYKFGFKSNATWYIVNTTRGDTLLNNQANQTGDATSPIAEGLQFKVFGAPNDAKDFLHSKNPSGPISPPTYAAFSTFNSWGFPAASGADVASGGGPATDYGGGRWGIHTGGSGGGDESYTGRFVPRVFRNDNFTRFVPYDFEIRFTAAGGKAYLAFTTGAIINVPFELWNIGIGTPNDPSDDSRMIPWINDADGNDQFNLQQADHGVSGGDNDPYTDWIYWHDPNPKTPGTAGYDAFVAAGAGYDEIIGTGGEVMARMVLVNVNGGSISDPTWPANASSLMPATGNVFRIISTKPNYPSDVFTINTSTYAAQKSSAALDKVSADKVGVFPNPYYAFNAAETNRFARFVTFNNLPPQATVRIFNLAGQLVRVLDKDPASTPGQFLRWDLLNRFNFPVASGIYIAHIEMTLPTDGSKIVKILKFAIIQEQEILDSY